MQKKMIIANWKMNPVSLKEAEKLFSQVAKNISGLKQTEVVVCPPSIYLETLKAKSKKQKAILGAQNAFAGDTGAFTGEISPVMLYDAGARYVILGHSERRAMGEDNNLINQKIKFALAAGVCPILCVGEALRDENHNYFNLVKMELEECLAGISKNSIFKIVVAYEPIWALSSTVPRHDATADDCREMAIFIRKVLADKFGREGMSARVVYGGSVSGRDAESFLVSGGVDGLLVGHASLNPKKFLQVIKICEALKP